jgi:hypothetical protein
MNRVSPLVVYFIGKLFSRHQGTKARRKNIKYFFCVLVPWWQIFFLGPACPGKTFLTGKEA